MNQNINGRVSGRGAQSVTYSPSQLLDPIKELILFTEIYTRDRSAKRKATEVFTKYEGNEFTDAARAALSTKVGSLISSIRAVKEELANNTISQRQYEMKKNTKINEIVELFSRSTTNGEGFGSPLPQPGATS